ncbi:beta strand repeat-containing protein [Alicyclobacillus sendaiensis]|uniref:beta strand repeat-containing protein n=1 Tax=Alicyclobacillus sendaiensis TaxID=192387 RepID=UPI000785EDD9|nr:hypothetical protein [Alicyclobacillus sendaiensis]
MAFAATSSTGLTPVGQVAFTFNGQTVSNPYIMDGVDSGNTTAFAPIYYFDQLLAKLGIQATWNGNTHTWALTDSNLNAAQVASNIQGGVGSGNTTITLNGTTIKEINTQVAKDPAGGPVTTYFPVYYIQKVFNAIGVNAVWNGATGLAVSSSATTESLSNISISGATTGTGSTSSPATVLNGGSLTLSTTLTDEFGNPVPNTAVTFSFTGSPLPTVTSNGSTVQPSGSDYTVYTNAQGVATITVTAPSGETVYYTVSASGPQQNVSTPSVALEFVAPGQNGIAPYGTASSPYTASLNTAVPVIFTLAPVGSTPQANVQVTFTVSGNAYFTNSSGANLGQSVTTTTNSSGQAEVWVNSAYAGQAVEVTATAANGTNATTYVEWLQSGVPYQVGNISVSNSSPSAGSNVTISGTVEDALGNPVANATILVTSQGGQGAYVSGSSSTSFPNVVVGTGTPATSTYGDVITTDANGNFSVVVTDSSAETDHFYVYPVSGGYVSGGALQGSPVTVTFGQPTSLAGIAVASSTAGISSALSNKTSSLSGIQAPGGLNATAYFDPFVATGAELDGTSQTYNLSVNNGGKVVAIVPLTYNAGSYTAGTPVTLTNEVSGISLNVMYSGGQYVYSVPGQGTLFTSNTPAFGVEVTNTGGNTVLTVSNGSVSATSTFAFGAGAPAQLANVIPVSGSVQPGQSETIAFTVEDANGNPVDNAAVTVETDASSENSAGFWVTQVNGKSLSQDASVNNQSVTVNTPIPLFAVDAAQGNGNNAPNWLAYNLVSIPGVVSWTGGDNFTVFTDSNGQVTLTLAAGSVPYYAEVGGSQNFASGIDTNGVIATANAATSSLQESLGYSGNLNVLLYATKTAANQVATVSVAPQAGVPYAITENLSANSVQLGNSVTVSGSVTDAYGNPITSGTVTITSTLGGSTSATIQSNGTYSATVTPTSTGTGTITVSDGSASKSMSLTVTPGVYAGAELTMISQPLVTPETVNTAAYASGAASQSATVPSSGTYTLTISAVDADGNPLGSAAAGQTATVSFTSGGTNNNTLSYNGNSVSTGTTVTFGSNGTVTLTYNVTTVPNTNNDTLTIKVGSNTDTVTLS